MDAKKSLNKKCVLGIRLTGRHSDMYGRDIVYMNVTDTKLNLQTFRLGRNLDEWTARHTDTYWEDSARM